VRVYIYITYIIIVLLYLSVPGAVRHNYTLRFSPALKYNAWRYKFEFMRAPRPIKIATSRKGGRVKKWPTDKKRTKNMKTSGRGNNISTSNRHRYTHDQRRAAKMYNTYIYSVIYILISFLNTNVITFMRETSNVQNVDWKTVDEYL